jgi:hypothetical protein
MFRQKELCAVRLQHLKKSNKKYTQPYYGEKIFPQFCM